jgi:hemoglobin/transferrin/lactoferrin receptor protein
MNQLQVEHTKTTTLYNQAKLVLAYQDYEESRNDRRLNNARLRTQVETVNVFTANVDLNKTLNEKSELFYGAEYVNNDVGSFASRININTRISEPTSTRYPNNSKWNSLGAYLSYKNNLSSKATLSSGIRYSYVTLKAPFDTTFFKFPFSKAEIKEGAFTANLGLVYRPAENWQINTNLSTGFRVPNIDDIGKVFDSEPGNVIVPNPSLRSEYAYNIDLGIGRNIRNKFSFDVTTFFTYLDNAIVRRPFNFNGQDSIIYEGRISKVQSLQNVAHATVWGIQAGYEWFFAKNFSWQLRANLIDGKETDDTKNQEVQLRHAPPFYGNTNIRYENKKLAVELYAIYNAEVSANNLAPSEQSKPFIYATNNQGRLYSPSWYTLNLKTSYRVSDQLSINAGLENITNKRYRPYSSGIVAAGTNFILSVRAGL